MRKSTLVKRIIVIGGLCAWAWFCAVKIPEYQAKQRMKCIQELKREQQSHDRNYVDIIDSEGNWHSVPRAEYEYEQSKETNVEPEATYTTYKTEPTLDDSSTIYPVGIENPYTEDSLNTLARLVESEAGIESYQCKLYVASVVLNRCKSEKFPNTVCDVIYQKTGNIPQFSVTIERSDGTKPINCDPSQDSINAATEVLKNGSQLPEDVLFFYANVDDKNWITRRETYIKIDHTTFAY